MTHVSMVMVDANGNHTTELESDIHRREMLGLQTLHRRKAIYQAQISDITSVVLIVLSVIMSANITLL